MRHSTSGCVVFETHTSYDRNRVLSLRLIPACDFEGSSFVESTHNIPRKATFIDASDPSVPMALDNDQLLWKSYITTSYIQIFEICGTTRFKNQESHIKRIIYKDKLNIKSYYKYHLIGFSIVLMVEYYQYNSHLYISKNKVASLF